MNLFSSDFNFRLSHHNRIQNSNQKKFTMICVVFTLLLLLSSIPQTELFPQGAPTDVCESFSPQRGHKVPPTSLQQSPFRFIQYGRHYRPGQMIGVEIIPRDDNEEEILFKGFLIQALDPHTLEFIGRFQSGEGLNLMPECSAVTHQNNKPKTSAAFLWMPPNGRGHGEVVFRATIVARKQVYFQNMLAEVAEDE